VKKEYGISNIFIINLNIMKKQTILSYLFSAILILFSMQSKAQDSNRMYRIAKIKVDAKQLAVYASFLQEQMTTAIKLEPGVLSYTAVADKKDATSITILEVYASNEAYQSHILTPHFKKYKDAVKDMVLALELIDTNLVCSAKKDNY
jgi:quinol monooxygenase YgiN